MVGSKFWPIKFGNGSWLRFKLWRLGRVRVWLIKREGLGILGFPTAFKKAVLVPVRRIGSTKVKGFFPLKLGKIPLRLEAIIFGGQGNHQVKSHSAKNH